MFPSGNNIQMAKMTLMRIKPIFKQGKKLHMSCHKKGKSDRRNSAYPDQKNQHTGQKNNPNNRNQYLIPNPKINIIILKYIKYERLHPERSYNATHDTSTKTMP